MSYGIFDLTPIRSATGMIDNYEVRLKADFEN